MAKKIANPRNLLFNRLASYDPSIAFTLPHLNGGHILYVVDLVPPHVIFVKEEPSISGILYSIQHSSASVYDIQKGKHFYTFKNVIRHIQQDNLNPDTKGALYWGEIARLPRDTRVIDNMVVDLALGQNPFIKHLRKVLFDPYLDFKEKFGSHI